MPLPRDTAAGTALLDRFNNDAGDDILGHIIWSSVRKCEADATAVAAIFATHQLGDFAPKISAPSDVFRRVVKEVQTTIDHGDGTKSRIWARDVEHPLEVVKRIVVEHLDGAGGRLAYEQSWDLRFNKALNRLDMYPITATADGTISTRDRNVVEHSADAHLAGLKAAYNRALTMVDQDGIRRSIANVLDESEAICVRDTGGVYFVPRTSSGIVQGLLGIARDLQVLTNRAVKTSAVAMPNLPEHVDDMVDGINDATMADADRLIADLKKCKEAGTVTERRVATMVSTSKKLKTRIRTFQGILNDTLVDAATRVEVLDGLLATALDLPVAPGA